MVNNMKSKEEYIEAITTLLQETTDIALLDLIYQLLEKSEKEVK